MGGGGSEEGSGQERDCRGEERRTGVRDVDRGLELAEQYCRCGMQTDRAGEVSISEANEQQIPEEQTPPSVQQTRNNEMASRQGKRREEVQGAPAECETGEACFEGTWLSMTRIRRPQ
jgi:hypothetical protein